MTTIQEDLIIICLELKSACLEVQGIIEKHGKHNQKTHANRFGSGQAKESLRRLKDDKGARERYKQQARKKGQGKGTGGGSTKDTDPNTWSNRLSKKEQDAILNYTGSGYKTINSGLRNPPSSAKDKKTIESIDSALAKSKLDKDTRLYENAKLYRAADIPEINAAIKSGNLVGTEFTEKGYTSTTRNKDVANNFLRGENARMFVINAPKGTNAADVSSISNFGGGEKETLIARNTKYKVSKVEKAKEKYKYRDLRGKIKTSTRTVEYIHLDVTGQG